MSKHTPMVVAAARELCKRQSIACNVNEDDNWSIYGEGFLLDAQAVVDAIGANELLDALDHITDIAAQCDSWQSFPSEPIERAVAAIAKATGSQS